MSGSFQPHSPDAAGILSWVHFGDLHMTARSERNFGDFVALIEEVNCAMAGSLSFAFLPGDHAEHGAEAEYILVREAVDALRLPWFSIVGDHDVHPHSFDHYRRFMHPDLHFVFALGGFRFLALNAFDHPEPRAFDLLPEQLGWLREELASAKEQSQPVVLFLHCYPSDLRESAKMLAQLVREHDVRLIDMGHTHYNEIANDGHTLYTTTRSTGQIEEGPVGFSITNIDGDAVSWRFKPKGEGPFAMITSPADARLRLDAQRAEQTIVRVKAWSDVEIRRVRVTLRGGKPLDAERIGSSQVWQVQEEIDPNAVSLHAEVEDERGRTATDEILLRTTAAARAARDQDNFIASWPEHSILGTQLGPNKNGRKW